MLTIERLKDAVEYDRDSGIFTRKTNSKYHIRRNGHEITTKDSYGYIVLNIDKKMYKAHRLAWFFENGYWPHDQIDHINGNPSDNRMCNLREASMKQNNENRKVARNNTSGTTGVRQQKYGKWRAYIYHNKRNIYLGEYNTFCEADAARNTAKKILFTHARTPPELT